MKPILHEHLRRNRQTQDHHVQFSEHRTHVMRLLSECFSPDRDICLVGAGNCNDVDLRELSQRFHSVSLVDLDPFAIDAAVARSCDPTATNVICRGDVDITNSLESLGQLVEGGDSPDPAVIDDWVKQAATAPCPILIQADVVVSLCLASQLIDSIRLAIGETHPCFWEAVEAVRNRHLQMLIEMTKPGGDVVFITDFVSSATVPDLAVLSGKELAVQAAKWITARNFFTGLNPFAILNLVSQQLPAQFRLEGARLRGPWRWDLGPRIYAVAAIIGRRAN